MELYASNYALAGNGRMSVWVAAEMVGGALLMLNSAEGDGTSPDLRPYGAFAVQSRGDGTPHSQTPYSHLHAALDGIWRQLAIMDGYTGEDLDALVTLAGEAWFDMIGESDTARRAYEHAAREISYARAERWADEMNAATRADEGKITSPGGGA